MREENPPRGRTFGPVAKAYDRARPSYPEDAVSWLTGSGQSLVLELGAGTGKMTRRLLADGHQVVATDPIPQMLERLAANLPIQPVVATAEHIPLRSRSVDVVVCGQSFHWFDHEVALPEIARVLRPGGVLALAWNTYDSGIPWVRRLKRLISPPEADDEAAMPLMETPFFGFVDQQQFRFWQTHTASTLADLARSVSYVAAMNEPARNDVLARVDALYADYGRGHDGMQLPWITECFRAVVRHEELPPEPAPPISSVPDAGEGGDPTDTAKPRPPDDPGMQLIDFR